MIDSFPYESWLNEAGDGFNTDITTFWTFGPEYGAAGGSLTGTYVLTALGMLAMVVSLIAWVWMEKRKLDRQAEFLRSGGSGPAS
jgi:hypothetical protein